MALEDSACLARELARPAADVGQAVQAYANAPFGFAAGIRVMYGTARQMAKDAERSASDERD
jgi:hypothetical protein